MLVLPEYCEACTCGTTYCHNWLPILLISDDTYLKVLMLNFFNLTFFKWNTAFCITGSRPIRRPNNSSNAQPLSEQYIQVFQLPPHSFRIQEIHGDRDTCTDHGIYYIILIAYIVDCDRSDHCDNKIPNKTNQHWHFPKKCLQQEWKLTIANGLQLRSKP